MIRMNGGPGRGLAGVEHDGAVDLALTGGVLGDFSDPQLIQGPVTSNICPGLDLG